MSFQNANQAIQEFITQDYRTPRFASIDAVMDARRDNTVIRDRLWNIEGKLRELKISYYPIDCDAVADSCTANICTPGEAAEPVQEVFNIARCIRSKTKKLYQNDVRDVDNNWNFSDHAKAQIAATLGSLRKQLATDIDTLLLANAGLHLDGNTSKRVTMVNSATGVVQPIGLWEIQREFADGGFMDPYVIGSGEIFNWKKALGLATDNNTTGQDYRRLDDDRMYYDPIINTVAGDVSNGETIIAFDPAALKFVTFSENVGIFATDIDSLSSGNALDVMFKRGGTDYAFGVFADPVTGILWDFEISYDKCTKSYDWFLRLYWDIFFPKIQACNIQGVNGIFKYRTCPPVLAPCPTGTSPVSPASSSVYNWTPGSIYPLYAGTVVIGGITTHPNVNVANITELAAMLNDAYGQPIFTVVGSEIRYTGYSALTGSINGAAITITFA